MSFLACYCGVTVSLGVCVCPWFSGNLWTPDHLLTHLVPSC